MQAYSRLQRRGVFDASAPASFVDDRTTVRAPLEPMQGLLS